MSGARERLVETARRLDALGLNRGTSGNVSLRLAEGLLITPSGVPAEALTPEALVVLDVEGAVQEGGRPSSEWRLHRDLYRARPEAQAVVHCHSPHATALGCLGRGIPPFHYMVAVAGGRDIRCAGYATFGTQALSDAVLLALEGRRACLMAHHGQTAFGETLEQALSVAVEVEALAQQYLLARAVGEPESLDDAEMARVLHRFRDYGAARLS